MKKLPKFLITLIVSSLLILPVVSFAQGLVPCDTTTNPTACGWDTLMTLINNVVSFILFKLAIPIAAIMFAYAGFLLITSGGEVSKRDKAKKIFLNVAIGLIIAATAWLIVNTILTTLGYDGSWIFGNKATTTTTTDTTTTPTPSPTPTGGLVVIPTPTADETDDGVLYEGGSLEETGCSKPNDLVSVAPSLGFDFLKPLKSLGFQKVFAQTDQFKEVCGIKVNTANISAEKAEVLEIANDFCSARCWLSSWYTNREIGKEDLMPIELPFNPFILISFLKPLPSEDIIEKLNNSKFKIINEEDITVSGAVAYSDVGSVILTSTEGGVVKINYKKDWANSGFYDVSILIHELNHIIENNGLRISPEEKANLREILPDHVFLDFFEDEWYNFGGDTLVAPYINFNYCYILNGQSPSSACYTKNKFGWKLNGDPDLEYDYFRVGAAGSWSEVTARLMEVRYKRGFDPTQNVTFSQSLQMAKDHISPVDRNKLTRIEEENSVSGPQNYSYFSEHFPDVEVSILINISTISILGQLNHCKFETDKTDGKVTCSLKEGILEHTFENNQEASEMILYLIARKLENLFNNTI